MKKIGREVCFIPTAPGNARNGEGSFARLHDGRILFVFTEFIGDDCWDHANARISACISSDEGESWTSPKVIIAKDDQALNIMSPSLIRLPDGGLGILYGRKEQIANGGVTCMPTFARSDDEGQTWSPGVTCSIPVGYYCPINDGAIVLRSGRILMPLSYHGSCLDELGKGVQELLPEDSACYAFSDDNGASWDMLPAYLRYPLSGTGGLAEPGIYEHEDGSFWTWTRTVCGFQYHAHSHDGGQTWTTLEPSFCFSSPDSPMRVKKLGGVTAAVFNPCPRISAFGGPGPSRTPLVCAVSRDDGHSFADADFMSDSARRAAFVENCYLLEDDPTQSYCYPALLEVEGGFLVAYYHSNGTGKTLDSTKIVKVSFDELTQA